jgi:aminoglycoside phosphotransferase (APT) family kinase protein
VVTTPSDIAAQFAAGARIQELTSTPERGVGANRVFRVWGETESRVLKVYGTPSRERRERRALEALRGLRGLPVVLDRGFEGDLYWALFADGGQWNLAALPENSGLATRAGAILRAVHEAETDTFSNLPRGIDQEWVSIDFVSTFRRIERYRGRLGLSLDLIEAARSVRPPFASAPRVAHTNPRPGNFLVDHEGAVTLVNWEWATLAAPEWDLSRALWLVGLRSGLSTARALAAGYGQDRDQAQLDRWTVYHAGMMLVYEAENRINARLDDLSYLVAELQRAVAGSRSAA